MMGTMRTQTQPAPLWQNWARTARATPRRFASPSSEAEVAALVAAEAAEGGQVRVVGAGHSFTPAVVSEGLLLQLDALDSRSEEHTSELQSRFDLVCR